MISRDKIKKQVSKTKQIKKTLWRCCGLSLKSLREFMESVKDFPDNAQVVPFEYWEHSKADNCGDINCGCQDYELDETIEFNGHGIEVGHVVSRSATEFEEEVDKLFQIEKQREQEKSDKAKKQAEKKEKEERKLLESLKQKYES